MSKPKNPFIKSPLNYTGGKHKLLPQIVPLMPSTEERNGKQFVDLFCGGGNVAVNMTGYKQIHANDLCTEIIELLHSFQLFHFDDIIDFITKQIDDYGLTIVNAEGYNKFREYYNSLPNNSPIKPLVLFVLICYSFNHQFRFNSKGEFNMPFGKNRSQFNKTIRENLDKFHEGLHDKFIAFHNKDFRDFIANDVSLSEGDYVYCDPPYLITCATYNEKDGWNQKCEEDLLSLLDELHSKGIYFGLSNVLSNKGKENTILKAWLDNHPEYTVHHLNYTYGNCSYHALDKSDTTTDEVFITNYIHKT